MDPWASAWDDAAPAPTATLPVKLHEEGPTDTLAMVTTAGLDLDPWGAPQDTSITAKPQPTSPATVPAPEPEPEPEAVSAPIVDTAVDPWGARSAMESVGWHVTESLPTTTAVDAQLASLASASMTMHDNVWGGGTTMQTAWTDEKRREEEDNVSQSDDTEPAHSEATEQGQDPTTTVASLPTPTATNTNEAAASTTDTTSAAPASTFSRLGAAVSEWRRSRATAAQEAKASAEAEQKQGWKKVDKPKSNATSRLAGLFKRGSSSATTSPSQTPTRARSPSRPPPAHAIEPTEPTLNADDLSWLDAATSKKPSKAPTASTHMRRYDGTAYDPDPRYAYDPPEPYDVEQIEASTRASPVRHDPYYYDPEDDTDEFGEMQTYTGNVDDDDVPLGLRYSDHEPKIPTYTDAPRPTSTILSAPPPGGRASHARKPMADMDLLSSSPPMTTPTPSSTITKVPPSKPTSTGGTLTHADLDFFENL